MAAALKPLTFPPFMTASSWHTLFAALHDFVAKRRNGTRLTNGEVITVVMAWMPPTAGIRAQAFPLWDQYAAAAYGWDPTTDKLDTATKNRDALYPVALNAALWTQMQAAADELDSSTRPSPRLDFDGQWSDVVFQNTVKMLAKQDGVITDTQSAHVAFKIPIPACKGPDGKPQLPRCKRVMKRWPYLCEEWEKCSPVVVDDPITKIGNDIGTLGKLALLVGAFYLLFDNKPKRRRARR